LGPFLHSLFQASKLIKILGGGSITDSAKLISFIIANDLTNKNDLDFLDQNLHPKRTALNPSKVSIVCIPTTLYGGEYSKLAVVVDPRYGIRKTFGDPSLIPDVVILDPVLAKSTPEWLWTSSGVRAIDHCVETLCRLGQPDEKVDDDAKKALSSLASGLLQSKEHPEDLEIRLETQLAANVAMDGTPYHWLYFPDDAWSIKLILHSFMSRHRIWRVSCDKHPNWPAWGTSW
jgi:alcohol dehydrogenase class IV